MVDASNSSNPRRSESPTVMMQKQLLGSHPEAEGRALDCFGTLLRRDVNMSDSLSILAKDEPDVSLMLSRIQEHYLPIPSTVYGDFETMNTDNLGMSPFTPAFVHVFFRAQVVSEPGRKREIQQTSIFTVLDALIQYVARAKREGREIDVARLLEATDFYLITVLCRAGLPVFCYLKTVAAVSASHLGEVWTKVAEDFEAGTSLGEAMGKTGQFSASVVAIVDAADKAGETDLALYDLTRHLMRAAMDGYDPLFD